MDGKGYLALQEAKRESYDEELESSSLMLTTNGHVSRDCTFSLNLARPCHHTAVGPGWRILALSRATWPAGDNRVLENRPYTCIILMNLVHLCFYFLGFHQLGGVSLLL